jgi:hypothetical protein
VREKKRKVGYNLDTGTKKPCKRDK